MQIKEVMRKGMIKLKTNNIEEPNLKSRLLMQYILNRPREYLLVHDDKELTLRQEVNYFKAIKKLIEGIPLQHITHRQEFMKLMFYVDENVLIPRPDTEILVEEVIKIAKKINAKKILDLCTGSGAIAISLAKYIEGSQITATDISRKALSIAKLNAVNNNVEDKITFDEIEGKCINVIPKIGKIVLAIKSKTTLGIILAILIIIYIFEQKTNTKKIKRSKEREKYEKNSTQ